MTDDNQTIVQPIVELLGNRGPADVAAILAEAIRGYCDGSDRVNAGVEPNNLVRLVQKKLDS